MIPESNIQNSMSKPFTMAFSGRDIPEPTKCDSRFAVFFATSQPVGEMLCRSLRLQHEQSAPAYVRVRLIEKRREHNKQ